jgi:dihydroorotate dehydrogenase
VPDKAIINRMGLNNEGAAEVASRLSHTRNDSNSNEVHVGINITKTPDPKIEGKDAVEDFLQSFKFMQYLHSVKWVTLNISCPNTAEGKTFEDLSALTHLVSTLTAQTSGKKLFLKLSPLQNSENKTEIIQIAKKFKQRTT